jgi:hypothetical protein
VRHDLSEVFRADAPRKLRHGDLYGFAELIPPSGLTFPWSRVIPSVRRTSRNKRPNAPRASLVDWRLRRGSSALCANAHRSWRPRGSPPSTSRFLYRGFLVERVRFEVPLASRISRFALVSSSALRSRAASVVGPTLIAK